jgi:diguanylate cyclase (GGDEF)-like protein/PAS domain S-box-containing protein
MVHLQGTRGRTADSPLIWTSYRSTMSTIADVERREAVALPEPGQGPVRDRSMGATHLPARVALAALLVVVIGGELAHPDGWIGQALFLTVTVGAAAAAWVGALLHRPGHRLVWVLVAAGVTCSGAADAIYAVVTAVQGAEPDVSVADAFWLSSYLAIGAGVLVLQKQREHGRISVDSLLNLAAVGVVSMLVVWEVSISSTLADASTPVGVRAIWAAYPLLDAVLLALVLHTAVDTTRGSRSGLLLAGGAACWLVADLLYVTAASEGAAWLLDAGWMAGAVLLAASAWPRASSEPGTVVDRTDDDGHLAMRLAVLGLAPLLVPGLFELWGYAQGKDPDPLPLVAATVTLAGLALFRAFRMIRADRGLRSQLRSSEHHYRALAANSSDAVVIVDEAGNMLNDSPNLQHIFGEWDEDEAAVNPFIWVEPEDLEEVSASFERVLMSPGAVVTSEVRFVRPDGTTVWLASRAVNLLHDPDVNGIVCNLHDITARKQLEEDLSHQAFHDSLTGLANRALLRDRLEQVYRRAARTGVGAAVIYLDLDGFKTVNDSLGHDSGDELLRTVAERLVGAVRAGDTVARLGGDEFAIVTQESARCLDEATAIADRALQTLSTPVTIEDQEIRVSASIGIATTAQTDSVAEVLRDADVAMYRAKAQGKGRWVVHDSDMRVAATERQRLEVDLPKATAAGQMRLEYQPVVELDGERLIGFEALLRWDHPALGLIVPDRFIPIAEETGAICEIGAWVLRTACATAAAWGDRSPDLELTMAVNVSGRQLASDQIITDVTDALEAAGLEPSALVLEMTETALIEDPAATSALLHHLHDIGVRLAIDDFGTGYSSLSYLRQFPVDILKIDRSFVATITDQASIPAIVRGLIDLGHTLDLEIVAEGVEERIQQDQLRGEDCALGQGFLFARPLSRGAAESLVANRC